MTSINGVQDVKGEPCISTGGLNAYLPCTVKADDLVAWGFVPQDRIRAGLWWRVKDQVPAIIEEIERRLSAAKELLK